MVEGTPEFTLVEWEEIVRRQVEAYEERKREYLRWTAGGLVAIAALLSVLLQTFATASLGPQFYLVLAMAFVAAYIVNETIWNLAWEKVTQAVNTLIGARRAARVWDLVTEPAEAARKPLSSLVADFVWPFGITGTLFIAAYSFPSATSGPLLSLAVMRVITLAIITIFVALYRRTKTVLPRSAATKVSAFLTGKVLMVFYYGIQLWLVLTAVTTAGIASVGAVASLLLIAAAMGVGRWIWRIAWPLVNANAGAMTAFLRIHNAILAEELADPKRVAAEVGRVLRG